MNESEHYSQWSGNWYHSFIPTFQEEFLQHTFLGPLIFPKRVNSIPMKRTEENTGLTQKWSNSYSEEQLFRNLYMAY